ncbi:hypothetical protein HTZ77_35165 [Nonomuraea sp. SMC257]|uniref:Secreted protein n=1 Tax=Nonomuraea montanisoli TaxID=2741721 RepID=A0A7Y6IEE6_9ACTN|nr:hypothetical protein [Nonomuraea montanisoli]NUW36611.1 hypothetical protein [Nonomuraea montanisoli]
MRTLMRSAVLGLSLATVLSFGAAAAHASARDTGPYCPDQAPWAGVWLWSEVRGGQYHDHYKVPFMFGWKWEDVACD